MNSDLSGIIFPTSLEITGQHIDISFLSDVQKQWYVDLLKEIISIYSNKQKPRVVIGFAGPSGSGKSVVVELLKVLSQQVELSFVIETLGIDAYSFPNSYLLSHYDDGMPLKDVKGRYDTYDVAKLENDIVSFVQGRTLQIPTYSRVIHDPVENSVSINNKNVVLLVEGLWILYENNHWGSIANNLDYSFFINVYRDDIKELTIKRHVNGGRTLEEASVYYDTVDAVNYREVLQTEVKADKVIPSFSNI